LSVRAEQPHRSTHPSNFITKVRGGGLQRIDKHVRSSHLVSFSGSFVGPSALRIEGGDFCTPSRAVHHYAKPLESTSNITRQHYDLDIQQLQQLQTRSGDLEVLSETPRIYLVKAGAAVQRQQPRPGSRGPRRNFRRSGRSSQIQISPLHHDTTQPPSPPPRVINTRRDPSTTRYT